MKICVAQTQSVRGNMQANIANHKKFIRLAAATGANVIVFPELSLTGYEPKLAAALATNGADNRFDPFQKLSDENAITIGIGAPIRTTAGINISMVLFQPQKERRIYSKKYIHADEEPFFCSGENFTVLPLQGINVAPAICYELSVAQHADDAFRAGAEIYLVSVAKTAGGVEKAAQRLQQIAKQYKMVVLMSNCIGPCEDFESAGGSAVWNSEGRMIEHLSGTNEGILIFDTDTQKTTKAEGSFLIK